jgi:phospholipid transport system substrate-binding protein
MQIATFLTLFLTAALSLFAARGDATEAVRAKQADLIGLLRKPPPDAERAKGALFDQILDDAAIAESSLGTEWAVRSEEERTEFGKLLAPLVRRAWEKNLKKTLDHSIDYAGEEPRESRVLVKTRATSKTDTREDPIEIHFLMQSVGGVWKVRDIVTEGVSLVSSYRSQFVKIIKKDGFPVLLQKMRDKLTKSD